jgi:hypothetical protein
MKLWNVGENDIKQLYNSVPIIIKTDSTETIPDDTAVFLLSKREIRGKGLVQIKDGDNKAERYAEGRLNIYNWNTGLYSDYGKHCEEREGQRLQPLKPHEVVVEAKRIIDEYEKWIEEGKPVKEGIKETVGEKKTIYACPYCSKEFNMKVAYFGHLRSHQKESQNGNAGGIGNKGKGEG